MASNVIGMSLSIDQPPQETVPYQLQSFISSAAWQARLRAVLRKGGRYLKPGFDAVWGIITFIATFAVPIALYFVALNVLPHKNEVRDGFDFWPYGWDDDGRYWKARGISIATFFGVILLTWGPMLAWKLYGQSQVNKMLKKFEAEDRAVRGPGAAVPTYRIKMPGIYSRHLDLTITIPTVLGSTSFQPGAELPPYVVNPPSDPAAAAFGTYYSQGQGQLNMPIQGVPLYNEFDEKIPEYSGPTQNTYSPVDEKLGYEDIKV